MNICKSHARALLAFLTITLAISATSVSAQTLVTNPPTWGTFFLASEPSATPWPFDPYFGAYPIYLIETDTYLIDDTQQSQNNSVDPPCDPCEGEPYNPPPLPPLQTNGFRFQHVPYVTNGTGYVVTLLDEGNATNAYEIYYTSNLLGNVWTNAQWWQAATGAVGVTNFTLPFSATFTNRYFRAARFADYDQNGVSDAKQSLENHEDVTVDSDDDGLPNGYESSHGTDPQVRNSTNGIDADNFTLYFELKQDDSGANQKPLGNLIRGPGFRVWGYLHSQPNGALWFFLQQMHGSLPLNIWTSGDNPPWKYENPIFRYELPAPDSNFHKYFLKCDQRSALLLVSNQTTLIASNFVWLNNMADKLGTDGPATLTASNLNATPIQNASYTPSPFPRKLRYHWKGVVGNTSQELVGQSIHSAFWPIKWMFSKGSNVFYTCGYNEPAWDVQRFHTNNHQFVNTNLSWHGDADIPFDVQPLGAPFPNEMVLTNNVLYVRYTNSPPKTNSFTVSFNPDTCAIISTNDTFPGTIQPTNGTLAIAVHPDNANVVAVYYQKTDQVVVYTNGVTNFVIGLAGGYSNGPSILVPTNTVLFRENVKLSGYYYDNGRSNASAALCFQSDGKLWVPDAFTSRMLRFDTAGLCDGWFMYNSHSYGAFADPNDPSRVFNNYLEFQVDYSQPVETGWVLTNYWGKETSAGHPDVDRPDGVYAGLHYVTTVTNGSEAHTFAFIYDASNSSPTLIKFRLAELTTNGLRITPIANLPRDQQLEVDGSNLFYDRNGSTATFKRRYITNWSGADPSYATQTVGSVAFTPETHPIDDLGYSVYKLANNNAVVFHAEKNALEATNFLGFHLGSVTNLSSTNAGAWRWTNSPTGPLNGRGNFDPDSREAGSTHTVLGTNIFYLYRGEGWREGSMQANQFFHYTTDGGFLGQFGFPKPLANLNRPGGAGNMHHFSAVRVNGILYIYTPDEGNHGIQRWRVDE
jgi:hypothetical protein